MLRLLSHLLVVTSLAAAPALAQRAPRDQHEASDAVTRGEIMSLGDIIHRVGQRVGGRLIGSSYDEASRVYVLRFMRGNEIVSVAVDARTGRMLNRSEQF